MTEDRLTEIAFYVCGLARFSNPEMRSRLQLYAQTLWELTDSFPQLRAAAHAGTVRIEGARQENQKLRQAVKELTETSEKLRELNRKAVAKALRQEKAIPASGHSGVYVRGLEWDAANLKLQLERTEKQHQAALTDNLRIEADLRDMIKIAADRRARINILETELMSLGMRLYAKPHLTEPDRQKLFACCRHLTEVIAGRPAQPGDVLTIPTE